jgi:hypothetical protein
MTAGRTWKPIAAIGAAMLLLLLLTVVGLTLALDRLVKAGIETVGTRVMGVPVRVADVDISLLKGSFTMTGFEVGNPPGFSSPHSLSVGRMHVDARLLSLLTDEIVMPVVEVEAPEATFELKDWKTNIGQLLEGLQTRERQSEKGLRIGVIRVRGARVRVAGLPGGHEMLLELPDVEMKDLTTGGEAASPTEVATRALEELHEDILAATGGVLTAEEVEELRRELEEALMSGGEGLDEHRRHLEEAAEQLRKELEDLLE